MIKKVTVYFAIVTVALSFIGYSVYAVVRNLDGKSPGLDFSGFSSPVYKESPKTDVGAAAFSGFSSSAQSAVLLEANSGQVLFTKNPHAKLPMASTAKILTAITVINNAKDLNATVKVPKEAVGIEGSSIYLRADESISYIDLLYGLMLQSGNDAATALAYTIGGSIEGFAKLMNAQAREYGAKNSSFTNPHGLHQKDNYTTAYDLALISAQAMKNPTFKKIVSTKYTDISNEGEEYRRRIPNKNKLLSQMELADGVKTGFTRNAGRCFVGSASKDGMQLIYVVLNCGPMFPETKKILETAIEQYSLSNVIYKNMVFGQVRVANRDDKRAIIVSKEAFSHLVSKHEKGDYEIRRYFNEIKAPIKKGAEAGKYEVYFKNQLIFSEKLYIIEDID